jgi:hypothetical protein
MKFLFVLLIIPVLSIGQTVHIKDEKIFYKGEQKINGLPSAEIFSRIQKQLPAIVNDYKEEEKSSASIKAKGAFKLNTPYTLVRRASYFITITTKDDGYDYVIDSVSFTERERGKKTITRYSEEVVEGMGETGKIVGETEKVLNETDMRFQKLLALLKSAVSKE